MELPKLNTLLKRLFLPLCVYFEDLEPALKNINNTPTVNLRAFILSYAWQYRWIICGSVLFGGLIAALDVAKPIAIGWVVDLLAETPRQSVFSALGVPIIILIFLFVFLEPLISLFWHLFLLQGFVVNCGNRVRWNSHRHVERQSWSFFQNDFSGRIATKIMQVGHSTSSFIEVLTDSAWYVVFYVVSTGIYLASVHWSLLLMLIVWFAVFIAFASYVLPKTRHHSNRAAEGRSHLVGQLSDTYSNIQTVKLFAQVKRENNEVANAIEYARATLIGFSRVISAVWTAHPVIHGIAWCTTLIICLSLWSQALISSGEVAATLGLCYQLSNMTDWALRNASNLFESIGTIENAIDTINQPLSLVDPPNAPAIIIDKGCIELNNVSFKYLDNHHILRNIDCTINSGERIGLVGPSGAGKSTLVHLLLRLFDVNEGRICIDNQDIRQYSQHSLRQQIGMVSQDSALFNRTIRDNIAYGKTDATEDEIITAANMAHAYEFIQELRDGDGNCGLDARVGERGVKLSGGQRQRIAIARVLLKDAPILILDEATASLDSETEAAIQEGLEVLMQNRTVIVIAHRLSTINRLDRLIVLNEGCIVESGEHDELINNNGLYADLWHRQSGGFI